MNDFDPYFNAYKFWFFEFFILKSKLTIEILINNKYEYEGGE